MWGEKAGSTLLPKHNVNTGKVLFFAQSCRWSYILTNKSNQRLENAIQRSAHGRYENLNSFVDS